jgi:mercuric ion transport protein
MKDEVKTTSAVTLVTGGTAAAFALAACCAIPVLLAAIGLGISVRWFAPMVAATQPYATILTVFSLLALIGSVAIVWRAPKHCGRGSLCARPAFRLAVTGAAVIGAVLLVLSRIYD